jgi:serine/threonine protein phosphatase PrpC
VIHAFGVSEAGMFRKSNEDRFIADEQLRLFAVADGMGGHRAGEVASRLAIEALDAFIKRSARDTDFTWPYGIDATLSLTGNRLRTGIHLANRHIVQTAQKSEQYSGMGTTIVSLLVNGSKLAVGHVGDSRLYLFSGGALNQLTQDDSTVLAYDKTLAPEQLAQHPMRNVLTNVLGAREQVDVHVSEHPVKDGDAMLLCSDGLHGVLNDEAIQNVLKNSSDVQAAAQQLVTTALERRSRDNVTALVVRFEPD